MTDKEPVAFGALLRRLRLAAGLTQEELAERAQLSERAIRRLERDRDRTPRLQTVRLLAQALDPDHAVQACLLAAARPAAGGGDLRRRAPSLPCLLTPLIGRTEEVAVLKLLLEERRLVTVSGTGGVGKTRLALAVAERLTEAFDRVVLVELAPLRDPEHVLGAIAGSLSLREEAGAALFDLVAGGLRSGRVLLVLDNMEHLLPARDTVLDLLTTCPDLSILITSREALRVRGERVYTLGPLPLPEREADIGRSPAVRLFLDRSHEAGAEVQSEAATGGAVAELCRRLDGLPLAIELAAAWAPLLSPQALLTRLASRLPYLDHGPQDMPARQRTMRDTIAWSYNLLSAEEQALFRRLSVFAGGCTMSAAEAVCQRAGQLDLETLDGLASLVDKSLLTVREAPGEERHPRFGMLETVREFAHDQLLSTSEAEAAYEAHARYYLALAEEAQSELSGPHQLAWLDQLEEEHDNLRAALLTTQRNHDVGPGLRLAGALWPFWVVRGYLSEASRCFEWAFRGEGASAAARAKALHGAGVIAFHQGEQARATSLLGEGLRLFRELDDNRGIAHALAELAYIANDRGEYNQSAALYTEALELFRDLDERVDFARTLNDLACVRLNQGESELARGLYAEGLSLSRELGDTRATGIALLNLGTLAARRSEYERAMDLYTESLELRQALGDDSGVALVLVNLAEATWLTGNCERAASLLAESLLLSQRLGNKRITLFCLVTLAGIAASQDRGEQAAGLWGASEALCEAMGMVIPPSVLAQYEPHLSVARCRLGQDLWTAACDHGRAMTLEQALDYALDERS